MDIIASKVKPFFNGSFDYDLLVRLSTCISKQIEYMEKRGITLVGLELADILSINNGATFVVANYKRVIPHFNCTIRFDKPFYKPTFSTTEVKAITQLPAIIPYLSARYSLGMMVVSLLGIDSMDSTIHPIKYTKLYWFLKRILSNGPVAFV